MAVVPKCSHHRLNRKQNLPFRKMPLPVHFPAHSNSLADSTTADTQRGGGHQPRLGSSLHELTAPQSLASGLPWLSPRTWQRHAPSGPHHLAVKEKGRAHCRSRTPNSSTSLVSAARCSTITQTTSGPRLLSELDPGFDSQADPESVVTFSLRLGFATWTQWVAPEGAWVVRHTDWAAAAFVCHQQPAAMHPLSGRPHSFWVEQHGAGETPERSSGWGRLHGLAQAVKGP